MTVVVRPRSPEGWTVVVVTGRLDAMTSPDLEADLAELLVDEPVRLALEFSGVDYMASPGLRVLLHALKTTGRSGGQMCLVAPRVMVRKVLAQSGVERLLVIGEAIESLPS